MSCFDTQLQFELAQVRPRSALRNVYLQPAGCILLSAVVNGLYRQELQGVASSGHFLLSSGLLSPSQLCTSGAILLQEGPGLAAPATAVSMAPQVVGHKLGAGMDLKVTLSRGREALCLSLFFP